MLAQRILAGLALAVCVALLARLALGYRLRARFDEAALRFWRVLSAGVQGLAQWPRRRRRAKQAALDAIRRAQGKAGGRGAGVKSPLQKGQWEGNVYKPDAFGSRDDNEPPPRRDLH